MNTNTDVWVLYIALVFIGGAQVSTCSQIERQVNATRHLDENIAEIAAQLRVANTLARR